MLNLEVPFGPTLQSNEFYKILNKGLFIKNLTIWTSMCILLYLLLIKSI